MKGSTLLFLLGSFLSFGNSFAQINDSTNLNTLIEVTYTVKPIAKINSADAEFSPVVVDKNLYFVSDRENDYLVFGENRWKKRKHLSIYKSLINSPKDDSVQFSKIDLMDKSTAEFYHNGPIGFHPSGNYAIVTRVTSERKIRTNKPQLYLLKKSGEKWSQPIRLPFCGNNFSYGHACFSEDGKKIYFASDQIGTLGGKDVFSCDFADGNFGTPYNLGDSINTVNDEMYPFSYENKLYFSSNRAGGFGEFDVYKSVINNGIFSKAVNLGNIINSSADDISFFITSTGRNGFFASNRNVSNNDDIYFFVINTSATVVSKNIEGKFTYTRLTNNLPTGLELQLLDEAGNVVQTTKTDANGNFKFTNLNPNQNFTIRVVQLNDDLVLHIMNKDGEEVAVLMSDTKGSFVYKLLPGSEVGTLAFMQMDEADLNGKKSGKINGQFIHERLLNESVEGLNVMLVDETGNIYMTTTTDKNGNFSFSKLPSDQNFFITTDSKYDDLKLLLYNNKDEVIADLKRKEGTAFVFRRVDGRLENSLTLIQEVDTDLFPPNYTNLNGKFNYDKLTLGARELDFLIFDEAGNVIGKGKTDKNGNFIITGLPSKDVYLFKPDGDDAALNTKGMKLQMLNRFNQELQMIDAGDNGFFKFDRNKKNAATEISGAIVIYFDSNNPELDAKAKNELKSIIEKLKANPSLILNIEGHTDASASEEFNMNLSMRRMLNTKQYFVGSGIASKRIKGNYHGEKQLVNNCTDAARCSDDLNRQNRRCVISLSSPK